MLGVLAATASPAAGKLNVLFIAVDDLRPELGCYGNRLIQSPNIDRLAKRGLVFTRAYCQQAVCSPSRTSLLTGRRPDTTKVYDLVKHFRTVLPDVVTLPQWFKQNGYHSQGIGKIYHGTLDDPVSWSVPFWRPNLGTYGPDGTKVLQARIRNARSRVNPDKVRGLPWEAPDVADNALNDGALADRAVELLREHKDKPFFLGVGFLKPHLAFVAPKKYWDLYSEQKLPLAPNPFAPTNCPDYALSAWGELRAYTDIPHVGPLDEAQARKMIHGYYACVSYMDAQLGRVLEELDRLKLRDRTIVILWGDHGWQLGEHGLWCKHTNFEEATRAPLIISVPGQKSAGKKSDALVEFVDIYPTVAELCGLPKPEGVEGFSFKPLLDDPQRPWKTAAFSQFPRLIPGEGGGMGHSIRTERYRLTEWAVPGKDFRGYELYDYQADPQGNENVAQKPEYAGRLKELTGQLHAGWPAALPR
jgi:arylsulfatase A-like enzyme